MKISNRRLIWFSLLLSYLWIVLLGAATHSAMHHIRENLHHHSAKCVVEAFEELASDEVIHHSKSSELRSADCVFKLALHIFSNHQLSFQNLDSSGLDPYLSQNLSSFSQNKFLSLSIHLFVLFDRGPPVNSFLS